MALTVEQTRDRRRRRTAGVWRGDFGPVCGHRHLLLSAELTADLRDWQDLFGREFHWDHGWRTVEAEVRYARLAAELLHRLRRELGPTVNVALDVWPVTDPELIVWLKHRQ